VDEREVPELSVRAASGSDQPLVDQLIGSPVGGLVEEVARSKRSVSVRELASETSGQALPGGAYDSFLGVPLRHPRGHLIGVLSACSRRHRVWSAAEVASLESFANSAGNRDSQCRAVLAGATRARHRREAAGQHRRRYCRH